ncbi:vWFA domain containing protein [uncultured Caudovirales phage]|uniref:VWFA domain containing protein n=1 Tax=uncultured Caudovirales phage TaxID=2100421 RepID=A0A6J5L3R3_9CAUD|nr:vWFA domain containing protein [uncultured Caudovirales phage]CAB5219208.1 vWFA domain containing protein [uncultured Caudovirales phage]
MTTIEEIEQALLAAPDPNVITLENDAEMSRELERLLRMCMVASKFSSTLALKPVRAELSDMSFGTVPAWSDAETIYFQPKFVGDLAEPQVVLSTKGLILHETAHIMLTPRDGSNLVKRVKADGLFSAMNALEDQRIETFMTHKFSNVADWLTAVIVQHLLDKPAQYSVAFPLLHGRKYLPVNVRKELQRLYENQQDVIEIASLVDEYILLNLGDAKVYDRAYEIIKRYDELMGNLPPLNPDNPWGPKGWQRVDDPNGHKHRAEGEHKSSANKPMNKADQDKTLAKVRGSMAGEEGDGNADEGMSDPLGQSDANDSDTQGDGASGNGADSRLTDMLKHQIDDILKAKSKEIANTIKQFNGDVELDGKPMKAPKRPDWVHSYVPSPEAIQAAKSFGRELAELKAEHDPGWKRRTEQGKLDVQRYSQGVDFDECFDEWDMGREDAVDIECVILLDTSPSMGSQMQGAYESMWAIKRALDKVNAATTVVKFDHKAELLYAADERADHKYRYAGMGSSTEPHKSLQYARSVLANSNRAIKLCISITDGAWYETKECDDILRHLRKGGVLTALAYISGKDWNGDPYKISSIDSHGCEVAVNITEMIDLFKLAREMVKVGIVRNLGTK